jgi:hypothetical protein
VSDLSRRLDRIEEQLGRRDRRASDAAMLAGQSALLERLEVFGVWYDNNIDDAHAPSWIAPEDLPQRRAQARRVCEMWDRLHAAASDRGSHAECDQAEHQPRAGDTLSRAGD